MIDIERVHDFFVGNHIAFYERGGPAAEMGMRLYAVVGGELVLVGVDAPDRATWYLAARAILDQIGADAYVVVSEAWSAVAKPSDDPASILRPGDRSDRDEVLITVAVDRDGHRASSVLRMDRYEAGPLVGAVRSLKPDPLMSDALAGGDLFELFDL